MTSSTPTFTLSSFPSWQSTPALALIRPPSLLMAFDKGNSNRELADVDDAVYAHARSPNQSIEDDGEQGEITRSAFRTRPASRPRSFLHILEDFQEENSQVTPSPSTSHFTAETDESTDVMPSPLHSNLFPSSGSSATSASAAATTTPLPTSPAPRIEDTTRRQQRFSLPIVGLQTTPVTTRANAKGEGLAKRFSLVLGGRTIRGPKSTRVHGPGMDQETGEGTVKQSGSMGHGVAASRLADLLGRRKGG
jgi:FYVE/RhoGEF/PH domain-containing protein 5/6